MITKRKLTHYRSFCRPISSKTKSDPPKVSGNILAIFKTRFTDQVVSALPNDRLTYINWQKQEILR